jgi:uncharacterized protein
MNDVAENYESVRLTVGDDESIAGAYLPSRGKTTDFAVLWVHGFGSWRGGEKATAVREECRRRGWAFAAFDFRGHGRSGGTMHQLRASRLLEDLTVIRAFLASRGHTRLGLVGSSMGGFASSWFAKKHPAVIGLVLLAPAFRFLERRFEALTPDQRAEWKRTDRLRVKNDWVETELAYGLIEELEQFRVADLVRGWSTPLLIYHGVADDIIPEAESVSFLRNIEYPHVELRLLKNGDHRLTAHKDEIAAAVGVFFQSRLA